MAFLKKHIVWLLLGAALLAEAGATFVLFGKQADANEKLKDLDSKLQRARDLKAKNPGDPKVIAALEARKEAVVRERGECLLFFWDRTLALGRLFDDKVIAEWGVKPWGSVVQMGVFKVSYQGAYNREVEKLDADLTALRTERNTIGFIPPAAFTEQADIVIGDIFAEQKEFWIRKDIIERAVKAHMASLDRIGIERNPPGAAAGKARLYSPVPLHITVVCEYPDLGGFVEELLRSPLCYRIGAIQQIKRGDRRAAAAPAAPARTAPTPAAPRPAAGPPREAAALGVQYVEATLRCELPDFNVGIHQVTFAKSRFPTKAKVKKWLADENSTLATAMGKQAIESWTRGALDKIDKAVGAAEKDKPVPITLKDRLSSMEYDFTGQVELARDWVKSRPQYEALRIEARKSLLHELGVALDAEPGEPKDDLVLTFRPKEHFDPSQMLEQAIDPEKTIRIEFGLVTYKPAESPGGIRRGR